MRKIISLLSLIECLLFIQFCATAQPVSFIENKGQWDKAVRFMATIQGGAFYILDGGYRVSLNSQEDINEVMENFAGHKKRSSNTRNPANSPGAQTIRSHAYTVQFEGASVQSKLVGLAAEQGLTNYFIGNDSSKWGAGCKSYSELTFKDVYPGIDIRYHTNGVNIEYDFLVNPGADPSRIALKFKGASGLTTNSGRLVIGTSLGDVIEKEPVCYQQGDKGTSHVSSTFSVKGNRVQFNLGSYDKRKRLVIDPELVFSSFTGSSADNWGYAATYDSKGNFYAAGIVFGKGYPVSDGAYQTTFHGGGSTGEAAPFDIGIFKFDPTGKQRLYATYLGGSGGNELPAGIIVDAQDNLVLCGRTTSSNYPVTAPLIGTGGGWDIIISKLKSDGTALIASRRIGGTGNDGVNIKHTYGGSVGSQSLQRAYGDALRSDLLVDTAGNIYIGTQTQSPDFPTTAGVFQTTKSSLQDAALLKFNSDLSTLLFSTCIGGSGDDAIYSMVLGHGDLFFVGGTTSSNFPGNFTQSYQGTFQGGVCDGFIGRITTDGTTMKRTTFIGTTGADQVFGIDTDPSGNIYIVGTSTGNMPVINAAFSQTSGKQFIAKFGPDLQTPAYITVFGTNATIPNISPTAFMVDRCENVYLAGWGGTVTEGNPPYFSAGTAGLSVTPDAIKPVTDGKDFYIFVLEKDATKQLYGSFFGQQAPTLLADHSDGGWSRFSKDGTLYLAICANCAGGQFPTTPGAWSTTNPSNACNQAAVKIKFDFVKCPLPPVSPIIYVDQNATGANDGSSWENAFRSMLVALNVLNNTTGITTVLVAKGEYEAGEPNHFTVDKLDAILLGGYPTGGGDRDPASNPTILYGGVTINASAQVDGFIIK